MAAEKRSIPIEVTYTEGYEQRFTLAILKIVERRRQKELELEQKQVTHC